MSRAPYRDELEALRSENAALRGEVARLRHGAATPRAALAQLVAGWALVAAVDVIGWLALRWLVNSGRDAHVYIAAAVGGVMVAATAWQCVRSVRGAVRHRTDGVFAALDEHRKE